MAFCGYKYKYRFNMSHSIQTEDLAAGEHFHTLEITLYIQGIGETFLMYEELEKKLVEFFRPYEGSFFNFTAPFDEVLPTIENISYEFYAQLKQRLEQDGYQLARLEMSETPSRLYTVTQYLDTGAVTETTEETDKKLDTFIKLSMPYLSKGKETFEKKTQTEQAGEQVLKSGEQSGAPQVSNQEDNHTQKEEQPEQANRAVYCLILLAFGFMSAAYCLYLKSRGDFPFGEDVYMILGKVDYLCTQLRMGRLAPIYMENWYNGYQMFVTTPPLPFYILAGLQVVVGNLVNAYLIFIGLMLFAGAWGFSILGKRWNNPVCGMMVGLVWILMPGVLPMFVSQGNPSFLCLFALFPFIFLSVQKTCETGRAEGYIGIGVLFFCAVLCQSFEAVLVLLAASGYALLYSRQKGNIIFGVRTILSGLFGVAATGPWLYVALRNGGWDSISLETEGYTVGIWIAIASLIGLFIGNRASRLTFMWSLILWGLAAVSTLPFAQNIPMGKYLVNSWLLIPAVGFMLGAMIQWTSSKRRIMFCMLILLSGAGIWQVKSWAMDTQRVSSYNENLRRLEDNGLKEAVDITKSRLLYLEINSTESFLPYYGSAVHRKITSTYKLEQQDCKIEQNVLQMENGLYNGYYAYVFDRALEGGNDVVVIGKQNLFFHKEGERERLVESAQRCDYELYKENENFFIFQNKSIKEYGIISEYAGIVIGKSASEAAMLFPQFQEGTRENIEEYSLEELKNYDKVLLMGFSYNHRENAEHMIEELTKSNVKVYIDMSQAPIDPINNQRELLDVSGQSIHFENRFHTLIYKGTVKNAESFMNADSQWDTIYLDNLDNVAGYSWVGGKQLAFCGEKDHVFYIGMNLIYHGVERRDEQVISILEDFIGEERGKLPDRQMVDLDIAFNGTSIAIETQHNKVNTTWAYQDTFESRQGLGEEHHYLVVNEGVTKVDFAYRMTWIGMMTAVVLGGILFIVWCMFTRIEQAIHNGGREKNSINVERKS